MEILKLGIVFAVITAVLWMKKPLCLAILSGIIAVVLLFRMPLIPSLELVVKTAAARDTVSVLLSFYVITVLQRMLEERDRLSRAQRSFEAVFENPRVHVSFSTSILGLLPSAAIMNICAAMVDKTCGNYLTVDEKMFSACFCRHVPEMFLPTFSSVLLALTLSRTNAGLFVTAMVPMAATAYLLVYIFCLHKLPARWDKPAAADGLTKGQHVLNILKNLWSLIAVVLLIIIFNMPVYAASLIVAAVLFITERFRFSDIPRLLKSGVEPLVLFSMYLIMAFKAVITATGVVALLPGFFSQFPIPMTLSFSLIFFFGAIISGSQAIIALCLPMAMASIPDGGVPLLVILMSFAWAAMQISPTHVCAFIAAEYFHRTLKDIIVKTLPVSVVFCAAAYAYGTLLAYLF